MKITKTYSSAVESATDQVRGDIEEALGTRPQFPCQVSDETTVDGSVIITLRVAPDVMKRHKLRANGMDINRYMWENILHRALVDTVY